jgi:hypothetical protein
MKELSWYCLLDLQLPMQSVPITTNVVSLNPAHGEVYLMIMVFNATFNNISAISWQSVLLV